MYKLLLVMSIIVYRETDEIRQIIRKIYNRPDMSNELITTYLRAYNVYKKEYLERL